MADDYDGSCDDEVLVMDVVPDDCAYSLVRPSNGTTGASKVDECHSGSRMPST